MADVWCRWPPIANSILPRIHFVLFRGGYRAKPDSLSSSQCFNHQWLTETIELFNLKNFLIYFRTWKYYTSSHSNHWTKFACSHIVWIHHHPHKRIPFIKHTCPITAHVQSPYRMSHKWTQTKGYDQHPVFWRPRTNNGSISSPRYIMYAAAIAIWIHHCELWCRGMFMEGQTRILPRRQIPGNSPVNSI